MYLNIIYESGKKRFIPLPETTTVGEVCIYVNLYRSITGVKDVYINVSDPNYKKEETK